MKIVFIASPFRASTEWKRAENVRYAERFALQVWKLGAVAVCPHANSARFDMECPDEDFLEGYRALLRRCDAVLVCGQESEGVAGEIEAAKAHGVPIFRTLNDLACWIGGAA